MSFKKKLLIITIIVLVLDVLLFSFVIKKKNNEFISELKLDQNKIFFLDKSISFVEGGVNAQKIIDTNPNIASTYYNPIYDPKNNYANTHFVAHNISSFGELSNLKILDNIMISDARGKPYFYTVSKIEKIDLDNINNVGFATDTIGKTIIKEIKENKKREVVLQTCLEKTDIDYKRTGKKYTVILVFAKENIN